MNPPIQRSKKARGIVAKRGTALIHRFEIPSDLAKTLKSVPSPARILDRESLKKLGKAISSGKIPSPTKRPPLMGPDPGAYCGFLGCPGTVGGQPLRTCEIVELSRNHFELRCYYGSID